MLHRAGSDRALTGRNVPHPGPSAARVLLAVAPAPRLGNPNRWGWPHWLVPAYEAGARVPNSHRTLEDYG
jgi:hypothetical protein